MPRRSAELQHHASQLGLETHGTRDQLMIRIRDRIIQTEGLDVLPQIDVMTAQNAKDFLDYGLDRPWSSSALRNLWESPDWVVEPKLDGVRVKAHFSVAYSNQPRLDSRRRSDVNYIYSERTTNFPHLSVAEWWPHEFGYGAMDMILDGELVPPAGVHRIWDGDKWIEGLQISTSIWNSGHDHAISVQNSCRTTYVDGADGPVMGCRLQYHAFDIIRFGGVWIHNLPFRERRAKLEKALGLIRNFNQNYHLVPQWGPEESRMKLFEHEIASGGEGVMFKLINSLYEFGKRSRAWKKLKRFQTIDAVIMGMVPATEGKAWEGLIGAFMVGLYSGDELIHVASCSAMPFEMRKDATAKDGSLNPGYMGKVVECRFQQMTTRSFRGRHAVMIRFRPDKNPSECTIDQVMEAPSEMMQP